MVDLDTLTSLCKRRGFLFQGSEIYGGLASTWDYGPLGVELKRNIKDYDKSQKDGSFKKLERDSQLIYSKRYTEAKQSLQNNKKFQTWDKNLFFLKLSLGFSHDIYFDPPEGVDIKTGKGSISISGIDKQLVGQVAAKIRSFRPPEPYKGKGVRYSGEYVKIKKGKTVGE